MYFCPWWIYWWNIDPAAFWEESPVMYYSLLLISGTVASVSILECVYRENGIPWSILQITRDAEYVPGLTLGARQGHGSIYEYVIFCASIGNFAPWYRLSRMRVLFFPVIRGCPVMEGLLGGWLPWWFIPGLQVRNVLRDTWHDCSRFTFSGGVYSFGKLSKFRDYPKSVPTCHGPCFWTDWFGVPRHPAQIYEALAYFFTFGINLLLFHPTNRVEVL